MKLRLATLSFAALHTAALAVNLCAQEDSSEDPTVETVEEVFIQGSRQGNFSDITEDTQKLVEMPGALGDPIAAIYSLPGVVSAAGENSGPAVRGSSPNDNRFFVDYLPAGYVFHEFTNSVFSEFILHDFNMYSAGFGPEYGGVTGAVFDIKLRRPRQQPLSGILDLSMLRSGLFLEGQVTEDSAFYLSARRSLIHLFIPDGEEQDGVVIEQAPRDRDYQAKYHWRINPNHDIEFTATGAGDEAAADFTRESEFARSNPDYAGDASLETAYAGQGVVWDYLGSNGHGFKLGLGRFERSFDVDWGADYYFSYELDQASLRGEYVWPVSRRHEIRLGGHLQSLHYDVEYDQVLFVCTEFEPDCNLNRRGRVQGSLPLDYREHMAFANDTWSISERWSLDLGAQWQRNDYTDETFFNPRAAVAFRWEDWVFTGKAGRYNRFPEVEQVAPELGNPQLRSPQAEHYTLGAEQSLDGDWSWSAELYYKRMYDLPLGLDPHAADSAQLYSNDMEGRAYGLDLLVNKNVGDKWYGWVAASLARSRRTNLRTGDTKDYQLDTPLILNWVMNYQRSERFNVGWRWTVRSGKPYTPIVGVMENPFFEGAVFPEYGEPFSDRLPTYSRLDVRLKWDFTLLDRFESAVILDIINVLNQRNVSDRTLDYDRVDEVSDDVAIEDTESTGIIPAATLRIAF